ncbi:MAG: substrate-binding domain-containing protein [Oscillospiraceae bacterium]|nr:substrate-binding domain-containing protein [Oscillospiraceae bacterium]
MKKAISLVLALMMVMGMLAGCGSKTPAPSNSPAPSQSVQPSGEPSAEPSNEPAAVKKVGFVTFGLGGDFFQMLADNYKSRMEEQGWEAYYADGKFNPDAQIEAAENYIAMGVDVLVVWSVAPEAMGGVVDQAMNAGIKFISFVQRTEKYDALMLSDDAKIAGCCAKLAAKWIDETYADAPDHSVPVAVLSMRTAESNVAQADVLIKIEEFSQKAKFVKEVEVSAEDADTGMATAENLYTTNPEIKVFLTAHNGLAQGVNNYFTSISSPVTDYSDMGIFCVNGDDTVISAIKASATNEAPLRGTAMTGSVDDTACELRDVIIGLDNGTIASGHIQYAGAALINADTVDEYLATGAVTSLTEDNI